MVVLAQTALLLDLHLLTQVAVAEELSVVVLPDQEASVAVERPH
jgi:hypothetical protein